MKRSLTRRALLLVTMLTAALIVVGWGVASAGPCITDGQACRTDQSCCSGACVKDTKKSFGTCTVIQCCVRSSPMGAFETCTVETPAQCAAQGGIAQGSGTCSPNPCPSITTTTTVVSTTTTTTTQPDVTCSPVGAACGSCGSGFCFSPVFGAMTGFCVDTANSSGTPCGIDPPIPCPPGEDCLVVQFSPAMFVCARPCP
jgi:hypothetical protein